MCPCILAIMTIYSSYYTYNVKRDDVRNVLCTRISLSVGPLGFACCICLACVAKLLSGFELNPSYASLPQEIQWLSGKSV